MTLKEKYLELAFAKITSEELRDDCVIIAEQFAIGFAEWLLIIYNEDIIYDAYTKEELLEIYKKENEL